MRTVQGMTEVGVGGGLGYVCVSEGGLPKDAPLTGKRSLCLSWCSELESLDNWRQVLGDPDGQ